MTSLILNNAFVEFDNPPSIYKNCSISKEIHWYSSYAEMEEKYNDMLDELLQSYDHFEILENELLPICIGKEVNTSGAKSFYCFKSSNQFFNYRKNHMHEHLHEIINTPQHKLYFDLDAKIEALNNHKINIKILTNIINQSILYILNEISLDPLTSNKSPKLLMCRTENPAKFSRHFIYPNIYTDMDTNKYIAIEANKLLESYPNIKSYMDEYGNIIDIQAYKKRTQSLRIVGHSKMATPQYPKLFPIEHHPDYYVNDDSDDERPFCFAEWTTEDTLLTRIYPPTKEISKTKIWPWQKDDINTNADYTYLQVKAEYQDTIYYNSKCTVNQDSLLTDDPETTITDPTSLNIDGLKLLLNSLDKKHVDNRNDWRSVCFAMGTIGTNDALNLLHGWAKKSKKYDRFQTTDLFKHTNGKTTIGTLLHWAKLENTPEHYKTICRCLYKNSFSTQESKQKQKETTTTKLIKRISRVNPIAGQRRQSRVLRGFTEYIECSRYLNIPYLTDDKYADIVNIKKRTTIYMNSPMGAGKTEQGKRICLDLEKSTCKNIRAVFATFRRSLASDISNRLSECGFVNYMDIKPKKSPFLINNAKPALRNAIGDEYYKVILQLESFERLQWHEYPDILYLDEIESLLGQLESRYMKHKKAVYNIFIDMVKYSKKVIVMDANISNKSIQFIDSIRGDVDSKFNISYNYKPADIEQNNHLFTADYDEYYNHILSTLKNGKNIAMATNIGKDKMTALYNKLIKDADLADCETMLINSETQADITDEQHKKVIDALKNIDNYITNSKPRLFIYSPTIQAGISITVSHFHSLYCTMTNRSNGTNGAIQMTKRIRKLIDRSVIHYFDINGGSTWSADPIQLIKSISGRMNGLDESLKTELFENPILNYTHSLIGGFKLNYGDPYTKLYIDRKAEVADDVNRFIIKYIDKLEADPFNGTFELLNSHKTPLLITDVKKKIKSDASELKLTKLKLIANADDVNDDDADRFIENYDARKSLNKPISPELYNSHKKLKYWRLPFKAPVGVINLETMQALASLKTQFKNIEAIYTFENKNYAIDILRNSKFDDMKKMADPESGELFISYADEFITKNQTDKIRLVEAAFETLGFSDLLDARSLTKADMWARIINNTRIWDNIINSCYVMFDRTDKRRQYKISDIITDEQKGFKRFIDLINGFTGSVYGAKIIRVNRSHNPNLDTYKIERTPYFTYEGKAAVIDGIFRPKPIPDIRTATPTEWIETQQNKQLEKATASANEALAKRKEQLAKKNAKHIKVISDLMSEELFSDSDEEKKYVDDSDSD